MDITEAANEASKLIAQTKIQVDKYLQDEEYLKMKELLIGLKQQLETALDILTMG